MHREIEIVSRELDCLLNGVVDAWDFSDTTGMIVTEENSDFISGLCLES